MDRFPLIPIVDVALALLALYAALGILFATAFHALGLRRTDPATAGAGMFFRALITPGIVVLWPLVALRWRGALGGRPVLGSPHRPLSAKALRSFHRRMVWVVLLTAPLAAGLAIRWRPAPLESVEPVESWTGEPEALPSVLAIHDTPFAALPVRALVRGDAEGRRQVELEIAADLERPALILYWSAGAAAEPPGKSAVFLGGVWGPGTRRYDLPPEVVRQAGTLLVYSLTSHETVARFSLPVSPAVPLGGDRDR